MIDLWYGDRLRIGHLGSPQRWVNILGRVGSDVVQLATSLNGGRMLAVSIGGDGHRLARPGDFNVEVDRADLVEGQNQVELTATDSCGRFETRTVTLEVTADGVRSVEPYYDRVIGLGDVTWTDYEIETTVTFHGIREPFEEKGDAGAMVIHAALATRWPGHDDDGLQPRVKWHPLGATAEFRVNPSWEGCSWRILGGRSETSGEMVVVNAEKERTIRTGVRYGMKHRVETLGDGGADYRVKLWEADDAEPEDWYVHLHKGPGEVASGGALIIAHYTDVTFGNVKARKA